MVIYLSTTVDSVQVLNIAQRTSVTVKSYEGLQLVGTSTDIETNLHRKGNFRIFPNPMTGTSEIEFFNFRESQINIEAWIKPTKMLYPLHYQLQYRRIPNEQEMWNKIQGSIKLHVFNFGLRLVDE